MILIYKKSVEPLRTFRNIAAGEIVAACLTWVVEGAKMDLH